MSTRFDDEVQASWGQFEARVGQALTEIGDDSFSIDLEGETDETGAFPYVQFVGYGDRIRAEVAGNDVLDPTYRIDADQESALVALGWQQPPDVESPNWWCDVPRDEVDVALTMVTAAFRQVFGVVHPDFLVSDRLWPDDGAEAAEDEPADVEDPADCDHAPVMGFPDDYDDLVRMVSQTLAQVCDDDVVRDDDGDFPIGTDTVPMWVRVHRQRPMIRIFSYVVRSVRDVRQARIEVGILNKRQDYLKFVLADGVITASFDLPATPFMSPQLLWALDQLGDQLDDLACDAAVRVGGKLWFEGSQRPSDREESA